MPPMGIEPMTPSLRDWCSAPELKRQHNYHKYIIKTIPNIVIIINYSQNSVRQANECSNYHAKALESYGLELLLP